MCTNVPTNTKNPTNTSRKKEKAKPTQFKSASQTKSKVLFQKRFQNPDSSFTVMTELLGHTFIPTYKLKEEDLSTNPIIDILGMLTRISAYIRIPTHQFTFLGLIYRLIINGHLKHGFKPKDFSRLKRKAFTCMLAYFNVLNLISIAKVLRPDHAEMFQKDILHIHSLFAKSCPNMYVIDFDFRGDDVEYDPIVNTFLQDSYRLLASFQGSMFRFLANITAVITSKIDSKISRASGDIMTFHIFNLILSQTAPFSVEIDSTRGTKKVIITDLEVIQHFLAAPDVFSSFLKDAPNQRKIIESLFFNLLTLYQLYYFHANVVAPQNLLKTLDTIFPNLAAAKNISITNADLFSFYHRPQLSKNLLSALSKVLVDATFEMLVYLALNFNPTTFKKSYDQDSTPFYTSKVQGIIKEASVRATKRSKVITEHIQNIEDGVASDIAIPEVDTDTTSAEASPVILDAHSLHKNN